MLFCLCFSVLSATLAPAQRQTKSPASNDDRAGEYKYAHTEGETGGGAIPVIEYRIVVSAKGDSSDALFTVDGCQANNNYSYTAKVIGNQLNLYFPKDLGDTDTEAVRGRRLNKGRLVSTLVKTSVGGKVCHQYKNGAYEISFGP